MPYEIEKKYFSKNWPLPNDYHTLTRDGQREARMALLTSWYDPDQPDVLITNPYNFKVAFKFFVDTYLKKSSVCRGVFARADCRWAPYWIEAMSHPSAAAVGFRGSSKTVWWLHNQSEFIAVTRPGTTIMVSEVNADRTGDEIQTIGKQLADNELIIEDFGRMKSLRRSSATSWSGKQLDLTNGSQIRGISSKSAKRGKHPLLWIIDDLEQDDRVDDEEYRHDLLETFFWKVGMGMMRPGSHVQLVGTFLHPAAVLVSVVKKYDHRFRNFKTIDCPLIVRQTKCDDCGYRSISNCDGDIVDLCPQCGREISYPEPKNDLQREAEVHFGPGAVSMWPEYYSVDDAVLMIRGVGTEDQRIRGIGPQAFWTEMMNRPELGGDRMFERRDDHHGYRIFSVGGRKEIEVVRLGEKQDYEKWNTSLITSAGVDIGYSKSTMADYSAIVVLGFDWRSYCYLLDAWRGRVSPYELIAQVLNMCDWWNIDRVGWEYNSYSTMIYPQAQTLLKAWKKQTHKGTSFVPVPHAGGDKKALRISRLETPMREGMLLFPTFGEVDGQAPMQHRHATHIRALLQEIDRFTRRGSGTDHDDMIDAYEMAYFVNAGARPSQPVDEDPREREIRELRDLGFPVNRHTIPMEMWTEGMWHEARGLKKEKQKKGRRQHIWN